MILKTATSRNGLRSALAALVVVSSVGATGCAAETSPGDRGEDTGRTSQALTANASAFAWSSQLTGTFTAAPEFASASNITVLHENTGLYHMTFPGLAGIANSGNGGNVQVTAYGGTNQLCDVVSWAGQATGGALEVNVGSFGPSGAAMDSQFTVSFVSRSDTPGVQGGYATVYGNESSVLASWNSTGQAVTVKRSGVGVYSLTFAGQSISGGTVEVTAIQNLDPPPNYCEVQSWGGQTVNVRCFTTGGAGAAGQKVPRGPVDCMFSLIYSEGQTNGTGFTAPGSPNGTSSFTYAWADQPTSASYQPNSIYQKGEIPVPGCCVNTTTPPVTVTRSRTGVYTVNFPQMPFSNDPNTVFDKSNVKVSAYGAAGEYCTVGSWTGTTSSASATVNCFGATGGAVDSRFTVTYSSSLYIIG
jgi:hypothetical protein